MIMACAFLYPNDPGGAGLIDLDWLKKFAPDLARKFESQMEAAKVSKIRGQKEAAAEHYYDIALPYADCQLEVMRLAHVDPPQKVDAVVTVFVE